MTDLVTCPYCNEVTHIGGLIGNTTDDCPRCGRPVLGKPLEWQPLWDAMEAAPNEWIPTTEKMYWEMLEALPPRAMTQNAFLVGEPLRSNEHGESLYACFTRTGENHRARNLTVKQFKDMTQ